MQIADPSVQTVCFQGYFTADDYSFQVNMHMPMLGSTGHAYLQLRTCLDTVFALAP